LSPAWKLFGGQVIVEFKPFGKANVSLIVVPEKKKNYENTDLIFIIRSKINLLVILEVGVADPNLVVTETFGLLNLTLKK